MQRVLVIVAIIVLVVVSLGVGALAANWPFWRRAWAWHEADGGWPAALTGPRAIVPGGGAPPLQFESAAPELVAMAGNADTQALLRVRGGQADAWFAPGFDATSMIDGRGLTRLLLVPLYAQLEQRHPGLLEKPVGAWLGAWRQDARGAMTVRELLRYAAGDAQTPIGGNLLNPFSTRARLASGRDFQRAALGVFGRDASPAADAAAGAQLLAAIAAQVEDRTYMEVLGTVLWQRFATAEAVLLLDRRRGQPAAHCCMQASAADWLVLALQPMPDDLPGAQSGGARNFSTDGRSLWLRHSGAAVLWIGAGEPPSALETLLTGPPPSTGETSAPE